MKTKHIVFAFIGGVLFIGFAACVLILTLILTVGESIEREVAGKLTIAVRHKMIYASDMPPTIQCVQPEIGICETAPRWNRETHRAGANYCKIQFNDPQPFLRTPETSDWEDYEFDLEPNKTYYWYVFFNNRDDCIGWLPADLERFETGELKLASKETKRIEKDFAR